MEFPGDLKYTKEHEWVRFKNGEATIGITEFAQAELGEIVFVELPAGDSEVSAGESFCVVESTKAASDVYAPVGGKVADVNDALNNAPDLLNSSSYDEGWIVKLSGVSEEELGSLLSVEQYRQLVDS